MNNACSDHLTFWNLGSQQLRVDFDGGRIVSDAGLLSVRALEKPLGILADLAQDRRGRFMQGLAEAPVPDKAGPGARRDRLMWRREGVWNRSDAG
jgi:hypothetical protein